MKNTVIPFFRRHRCEVCGDIFECLECTMTMLLNTSNEDGVRIYSSYHDPAHNREFLCPTDERKPNDNDNKAPRHHAPQA